MKKNMFPLCVVFLFFLGLTVSRARAETLTVPFVDGTGGVTTSINYSGLVWVDVRGVGQAAGTQYSDAFYVYTDSSGNALTGTPGSLGCPNPVGGSNLTCPWHDLTPLNWVLQINGEDPINLIVDPLTGQKDNTLPPYNPFHDYVFEINLPTSAPINFSVADTGTGDNTGSYQISVMTPEPGTLWLLSSGLAGLTFLWRRRSAFR